MSNHVFVSHSHEDSPAADSLVKALEERGVTCWLAPRDVPPGGSYVEALLNAIESASCFVLIYSAHSNASSHVLREVERALKFGVNIIPVRFDDSSPSKSLDYLLATVHWLSVPSDSRNRSIIKVAEQIAACVPKPQGTQPIATPDQMSGSRGPIAPVATSPARHFLWIGAAILLALITGAIVFFVSRKPAQPQATQRNEVATSATVAPAATPVSATTAATARTTESAPAPSTTPPPAAVLQATAPPSSTRQAVQGVVQDPDGIANVREQPSLQGKIVGVVRDGERVEIDGMQGDWVHIILGPEKSGYIHKSRVKIRGEK